MTSIRSELTPKVLPHKLLYSDHNKINISSSTVLYAIMRQGTSYGSLTKCRKASGNCSANLTSPTQPLLSTENTPVTTSIGLEVIVNVH